MTKPDCSVIARGSRTPLRAWSVRGPRPTSRSVYAHAHLEPAIPCDGSATLDDVVTGRLAPDGLHALLKLALRIQGATGWAECFQLSPNDALAGFARPVETPVGKDAATSASTASASTFVLSRSPLASAPLPRRMAAGTWWPRAHSASASALTKRALKRVSVPSSASG